MIGGGLGGRAPQAEEDLLEARLVGVEQAHLAVEAQRGGEVLLVGALLHGAEAAAREVGHRHGAEEEAWLWVPRE